MNIIFARHGESFMNAGLPVLGDMDSHLTMKGVQQAIDLGESLRDVPIDTVITSTIPRAIQTAQIALSAMERPLIIHQYDDLDEINLRPNNVAVAPDDKEWWEEYAKMEASIDYMMNGEGESQFEVYFRVKRWLRNMLPIFEDSTTILIVSHLFVMKAVTAAFMRNPEVMTTVTYENGSYFSIEYEELMERLEAGELDPLAEN